MSAAADGFACRSCGGRDVHLFLELGDMPLSDGLLREADLDRPEPRFPLDVVVCRDCSLVQIQETVPPEQLFCDDYPYFSSFSDALLEHSRANVEARIEERRAKGRALGPDSLVVELASNDGYLLQYYQRAGIPVLGIDPADGPAQAAEEKGVPTLNTFFTLELAQRLRAEGKRADLIHGNNVLAHVPDLNGFVEGIATLLADDGMAVIEAPYLLDLIEHCEFDTIYHEHLCYFSVTALCKLFARHGLSFNRVEQLDIHGGSLRMFVEKREDVQASVREMLAREDAAGVATDAFYRGFSDRVTEVKRQLSNLVGELRAKGKTVAAYGAAAKGAILLNYVGIGGETLAWVADRNVHKQGRYMPGVHVPIVDPERLLEDMPDYVLILPWNFKDEILRQQDEYRKRGGRFIVPIPTPEIV